MKKFMMILVMVILIAMPGFAERVSPNMARRVAQTFLGTNRDGSNDLSDVTAETGFRNLYVFTTENSFVVLSADDRVQPVLGYSMTSKFVAEDMPDNVREWLQSYADQIQYIVDNQLRASYETSQQWMNLCNGNRDFSRTVVVAPLIQTLWDQGSPFNNLCPYDSNVGEHAVTGCVATAMAQLMNYWEHPTRGTGSHSYSHSTYGQLSANFGNTVYDWDNMRNIYSGDYTDAEVNAVATLMYHCGVAMEMDYGTNSSGAVSAYVRNALINYFNYSSSMSYLSKSTYSNAQWISMLKTELDNARPVFYAGRSSGSGHAFICDGYDSNNGFHINWGWSGYCDGYYTMGALNPGVGGTGSGSGQYNLENAALFGCQPNTPSINPPTIAATVSGRNVTITWNSVSGAVSYKLYRNGNLVVSGITGTSYTDSNLPYGDYSYYVKSVKSDGTMSLKSNTIVANVHYEGPVVTNLQATTNGGNVHLSWSAPSSESAILKYGTGSSLGGVGFTSGSQFYWAQRYPVANLISYAGMAINKVSVYFGYTGTYTLYIYNGNEQGTTDLLYQTSWTVSSTGWKDLNISSPVALDYTNDLWVVMYAPAGVSYPANYCSYTGTGVENAAYYSSSGSGWMRWGTNQYSWLMKTYITDGTYTYNIYRNDLSIATNVSNTYYNDNGLTNGLYNYYVKTNYYGGESDASNSVNVVIGNVNYYTISASASPANGGTVTGAGSFAQGSTCTLTASANEGYTFTNWTKNGQQVSTNPIYSFTVTGNASFVANFTEIPPTPEGLQVFAEYYPDANNPNSPYVRVYWYESKASRSVYNIYRASCDGSDVTLLAENVTDSEYIDQTWAYLVEGNYKYGVSDVEGKGESEIHWNNTPAPMSYHTIDASAFVAPVSNNENTDEPSLVKYNRGWLYYDDGICTTNVGAGGTLYWGSMFPASMLTGTSLTKVALYENGNNTGTITLNVYSGGSNAPGTLVHTQSITPAGGNQFHEITLSTPVTLNPSQNLWITFYQSGDTYPACACNDTGDANNRWMSFDGNSWMDLANAGLSGYGWMIRAFVANAGPTVWSSCLVKSSRAAIGDGGTTTNQYLPSYSYYKYTLSQQIYTSDEVGDAGTITSVSFFNGGSEKTRTYDVYMVHTNKSSFANNTDWITVTQADRVFSGTVTMTANGWTALQFNTPFVYNGTSNIALIVDDNSGNYTNSPHMACRVFNANGNQAIRVYSDGINYDPYSPSGYSGSLHSVKNQIILGFSETNSQMVTLNSGWNWFSTNLDITLDNLQSALVGALPGATNIRINAQNGTTSYNGSTWRGTLNSLDVTQMYMIQVNTACELTLTGMLLNPAEHPVTIHNGSNWIGFQLGESMSLLNAFSGFAVNGDKVTSQSAFSTFNGSTWRGTLDNLAPGQGYIFNSSVQGDRIFTFPINK